MRRWVVAMVGTPRPSNSRPMKNNRAVGNSGEMTANASNVPIGSNQSHVPPPQRITRSSTPIDSNRPPFRTGGSEATGGRDGTPYGTTSMSARNCGSWSWAPLSSRPRDASIPSQKSR